MKQRSIKETKTLPAGQGNTGKVAAKPKGCFNQPLPGFSKVIKKAPLRAEHPAYLVFLSASSRLSERQNIKKKLLN